MKESVTLVVLSLIVIWTDHTALTSTTTATRKSKTADGCITNYSWTPRNRSCYLHLAEIANFSQAVGSCLRLDAHLVSIGSEEENKFIRDLVGTSYLPVWIGLYRLTNDICVGGSCGFWIWLDNSELVYSQWAVGSFPTPGQCTNMDSRGDWEHGRPCSAEFGYVCKQKRIFPATISEESTTTMRSSDMTKTRFSDTESTPIPDGCPSDLSWEPHNQSCYLHSAVKVKFTQANHICEELGAHLVSISSGEENQFIVHFVGMVPVWIGLYRTTTDLCLGDACGNWMWLDKSELRYSHWAAGPFPSPGQCTYMNSLGQWYHNTQCSDELSYVCKQKRIFPVTISESRDMSEFRSSDPGGNVAPTTDSANKDQSSLYTGVGVTVCILVIVVVIGIMMYYIKTRRGKRRKKQSSAGMSHGTSEYENDHRESVDQYPVYVNSIDLNPLSGGDIEIHAKQQGVTPREDPVYEEVVKYSEINPEYTALQPVECSQTSAVTREHIYEVYLNAEQN